MIDVNLIRDSDIALHGLTKADEAYTIYYDETNNIRRLHVRADGLNVSEPKYFVIAGIAYRGAVRDLNIAELRNMLRVQTTAKEIKLDHVAKGDFLFILKARKLEIFLRWLFEQDVYIHYSVMDPLYWSVVDIIDSILTEYGNANLMAVNKQLKNVLYTVLRYNQVATVDLFQRYSYPNVGREHRQEFLVEIHALLNTHRNLLSHFDFMMLRGILQIAEKLDALPYLEDEAPNVLIEGFGHFYIHRICLFKNSQHVLDVEEAVQNYIGDNAFVDGDRVLKIHRFLASHEEPGIQLSDIIAGLLGKFFSMIQSDGSEDLAEMRAGLSAQQEANLSLFSQLLDRSLEENPAFAHFILSLEDQQRSAAFLRS